MATVLAAALLTLAGCASDEDPGPSEPSAQSSASPAPAGGTPDQPAPIEATTSLMEWVPAPGAVANTVTTNGTWFLTVEASGDAYRLDGPDQAFGTGADGTRITNALLDTDWAVVVRQDEGRKKPATAEITDLAKGEQFTIDEASDVPTISGGTWALGGDTLAYATLGPDGGYCVATSGPRLRRDLDRLVRRGQARASTPPTSPTAAPRCSASTTPSRRAAPSAPSATTSSTPSPASPSARPGRARRSATMRRSGRSSPTRTTSTRPSSSPAWATSYYDLGPGTSGTLVPCADAAYFVRDPKREGDPARLLRWDGSSLAVVYEAPPGQSFLEAPRCGDAALVVTALSEGGDEQVMAALSQ